MFGHRMKHKSKGITLIELLVAVSILGIIAAIAVPSFSNMMKANRLTATSNELLSAISTARSEAIKQRKPVSLVPRGGSWIDGWDVVLKSDNTIKFLEKGPLNNNLDSSSTGSKPAINFKTNGYLETLNPWGAGDGVRFCDDNGKGRVVIVSTSGSFRIQKVESS